MARSDWAISAREDELRQSADADLPMLALADAGSRLLVLAIQMVNTEARRGKSAEDYRRLALWSMAIITFRALRAAMHAVSVGYEDQAVGYQRLIDELHNRAQKVRAVESGSYAREWLDGRNPGKGATLAGRDFWDFLSGPVHANVRAVLDWIAISEPGSSSATVIFGPERRPALANPMLVYMAGEARDIAAMLAAEGERQLNLETFDERLQRARAEWIPDDDT